MNQTPNANQNEQTLEITIRQILNGMSLEEKVGQLFVIGFDGQELDDALREMVTQYGVGGVIFFARNVSNPRQVAGLTNALQAAAKAGRRPGLIVAVDQEGGRVARLTEQTGFTEFPGGMAMGATGNPEIARRVAAAMAAEMRSVGFNTDFAPDLDINNNPDNPVIGLRSFGSNPERVAAFGAAFTRGLQENGVMAFGKHFPGHGDTAVDSHVGLPVVPHGLERLETVEFVPFRAAMQAGIAGIMSAHVGFPVIDPDGLPGTLSPKVMTGLVREALGFQGLLATDSLEMGALGASGYPVPQAALQAFAAGADLLLFNRDHELHKQAFRQVLEAAQSGEISIDRLDASVTRILLAKAHYGLLEPAQVDATGLEQVRCAANIELSREVARAALTVVRCAQNALPFKAGEPLLVVEIPAARGLGARLKAGSVSVTERPNSDEIEAVVKLAAVGCPVVVTTSDAKLNPAQVSLVEALCDAGNPLVVAAVRNPYDLMAFPQAQTYIATYGSNPPTLEALADLLLGRFRPSGRLPVELPRLPGLE